ncbi:hypothetical protein JG688_00001156 [Phytophthora aleatoria]|uniref:Uncharacterized protein n=1 Tax=Phytophthora aleatoria TaxID=2496075 RepID=A0A8J5MJ06_9STRA|nr:hypothetical protein JG688_00001156 [Phytophthora aleatoria]
MGQHKSAFVAWLEGREQQFCSIYAHFRDEHEISSRNQLREFEQLIIDTSNCVNQQRAIKTEDEHQEYQHQYYVSNAVKLRASAGVYTTSDARRKNFFDTLDNASIMNGMLSIRPKLYRYKSQDNSVPLQIGYKLLKNNLGSVVNFFPNETLVVEDSTIDIEFSVDYSNNCCYLHILALEQQSKISALASTATDLTNQLATANAKITDHEIRIKKSEDNFFNNLV